MVDAILPIALPRASNATSSAALLEAWLGCFAELVAVLDWQTLSSRVLPAVIQLTGTGGEHSVPARCICCRSVWYEAADLHQERLGYRGQVLL